MWLTGCGQAMDWWSHASIVLLRRGRAGTMFFPPVHLADDAFASTVSLYDLINHTHKPFLFLSFSPHSPLSAPLSAALPPQRFVIRLLSFRRRNIPPFFLLPQWFISVLCCLWRLNGASLTGPSTDSRLRRCSCGYRIDVRAGTPLLQITRSAFSV